MEIAVLAIRVGASGAQRQVSVNRHVHREGLYWVGRHPDFYDGVDAKNTIAETVVLDLEHELEDAKNLLGFLEEKLLKDSREAKKNGASNEEKDTLTIFLAITEAKFAVIAIGGTLEIARENLARIQKEFPRLVSYVGSGVVSNLAPRLGVR